MFALEPGEIKKENVFVKDLIFRKKTFDRGYQALNKHFDHSSVQSKGYNYAHLCLFCINNWNLLSFSLFKMGTGK